MSATEALKRRTTRDYFHDTKDVLKASVKMAKYTFDKTPWAITGYTFFIIINSLLPFLSSWINSRAIDILVETVNGNIEGSETIFIVIAFSIAVIFLRQLAGGLINFFEIRQWYDLGRELGNDVITKYSNLDIEYFEDPQTLDLLNEVRENYADRPLRFIQAVVQTLDPIISILTSVTILWTLNPVFIFILLVTSLPRAIINIIFGRRTYGIWAAKGDVRRDYWDSRAYFFRPESLMEVRIFRLQKYLLNRTYNLFYNFQKEQIAIENKRSMLSILVDLLGVIGYGAVMVVAVLGVLAKELTIGNYSFYMATVGNFTGSINLLFRRVSQLFENGLFVRDVFKVIEFEEKIIPGEVCLPRSKVPPLIEFIDVSFAYPNTDRLIFDKLNLTINPKEHVAIVGENGSGKTTLIKLLLRFYDVKGGAILINGINIKHLDPQSWYSMVGALFQEFNFYHFDAKTNIGVGNIDVLDEFEKIVDSAKKTGAHEFIEGYENKYNQVLSRAYKGGIQPSVGQKQKIALARAFFKNAPILILDEPTSAIDPKAEFEIFEKLFDFADKKSVIIISHRFSTVRNAKRIIVLEQGKIIEDGSHEQLMQLQNGIYKHAFELQRRGYE